MMAWVAAATVKMGTINCKTNALHCIGKGADAYYLYFEEVLRIGLALKSLQITILNMQYNFDKLKF